MTHLRQHATDRHATGHVQLLRYASGRPITRRRYNHLWTRLGNRLYFVAAQQISTHWLRHTTLTWVERNFGFAVAHAYAGHTDGGWDGSSTSTYVRANVQEVAAALAALTGEPHPLAGTAGRSRWAPCTSRTQIRTCHTLRSSLASLRHCRQGGSATRVGGALLSRWPMPPF